jgi:hypothetical protein
MPLAADGLQLQYAAILSMEKIVAIREYTGMVGPNGTFSPGNGLCAAPVLRGFRRLFYTEFHSILDAGRQRRN